MQADSFPPELDRILNRYRVLYVGPKAYFVTRTQFAVLRFLARKEREGQPWQTADQILRGIGSMRHRKRIDAIFRRGDGAEGRQFCSAWYALVDKRGTVYRYAGGDARKGPEKDHSGTNLLPKHQEKREKKKSRRRDELIRLPRETPPPLPPEPTSHAPGSPERIEVMRQRVAAGFAAVHPQDAGSATEPIWTTLRNGARVLTGFRDVATGQATRFVRQHQEQQRQRRKSA